MMSILLVGLWNGDGWGSGRNGEYDQVSGKGSSSAGGGRATASKKKKITLSPDTLGRELIKVIKDQGDETKKLKEVKQLISNNANVNAQSKYDNTPLMWAACKEYLEIVKTLLDCPTINVNVKKNNGNTALMYAAEKGYLEIVQALLTCPNIDVNAQDNNGISLLRFAINKNNSALVRLLINNGANVWGADIPNPPQIYLTCYKEQKEIYQMIQDKRDLLEGLAETVLDYHTSTRYSWMNSLRRAPSRFAGGSSVFGSKTPIKAFKTYLKAHLAKDFINNGHISLDLKKQNDNQQATHEQNNDEISTSSNEKQDVFKVVDDSTGIKLHPLDLVNRCYGNQHNKTILMVLAKYGQKDIVEWLFNQSKLPNRLLLNTIVQEDSIEKRTAEEYATRHQYGDIARMIKEKQEALAENPTTGASNP